MRRKTFRTREETRQAIFEYIEIYYNRKRAHSTLGYKSPSEYDKQEIFSKQLVR
ncbi:MAG: IS3 family transposase [Candidatus Omnitrophica bacterium]|nr:IS3 family transposase [Candidatus Omnitrophota bacterium]